MLHLWNRIFHGDPIAAILNHFQIILIVAKSGNFGKANTMRSSCPLQGVPFGGASMAEGIEIFTGVKLQPALRELACDPGHHVRIRTPHGDFEISIRRDAGKIRIAVMCRVLVSFRFPVGQRNVLTVCVYHRNLWIDGAAPEEAFHCLKRQGKLSCYAAFFHGECAAVPNKDIRQKAGQVRRRTGQRPGRCKSSENSRIPASLQDRNRVIGDGLVRTKQRAVQIGHEQANHLVSLSTHCR